MKHVIAFGLSLAISVSASFADPINKIASAGGDITEILFELGVGDKVVAVDSTSIYPPEVKNLNQVGYVRGLSAEGVLATGADLLVGSHDMGPPSVMDNLQAAGMKVAFAPEGTGAERFVEKVKYISEVVDKQKRGAELIANYNEAVENVQKRANNMGYIPKVMLILSVRDNAPIVAGFKTTGHDIIDITGGQNVATFEGWKPMNSEAIIASKPDILVLSTLHVEQLGGLDTIMKRPDISLTPAGINQSYAMLSPQLMLQFGPRAPIAMNDLVTAYENLAQNK